MFEANPQLTEFDLRLRRSLFACEVTLVPCICLICLRDYVVDQLVSEVFHGL